MLAITLEQAAQVLGIIGGLLGLGVFLNSRLDRLDDKMDAGLRRVHERIDNHTSEESQVFAAVRAEVSAVRTDVARVEGKLDVLTESKNTP